MPAQFPPLEQLIAAATKELQKARAAGDLAAPHPAIIGNAFGMILQLATLAQAQQAEIKALQQAVATLQKPRG